METKECQFCISKIPIDARKCKFCLEWQDDLDKSIENETIAQNTSTSTSNLRKPFQFKLVENIPIHYSVSVLIFCTLIFASVQISWYILNENRIYLLSFLAFSIQMYFSWFGLIWVYKIFNDKIGIISSLYPKNAKYLKIENNIFNNKLSLIAGLITGITASIGDWIIGTPFKTIEGKIVFFIFELINMSFAGAAIFSMLTFAFFIYTVSLNEKEIVSKLKNTNNLMELGSLHLKTSLLAIFPLILGVIAKLIGDWSWGTPVLIWYSSFAILIMIYIYLPLVNVRAMIKMDIQKQVNTLQSKILLINQEIKYKPNLRKYIELNELRSLEKSILNQNTWPFEPKNISAIFFAIIVPIILMIVNKIWKL
jgi:hypothetical protein